MTVSWSLSLSLLKFSDEKQLTADDGNENFINLHTLVSKNKFCSLKSQVYKFICNDTFVRRSRLDFRLCNELRSPLRGCPCKNRPPDFRPKTEFLQIFRVRQLVHMINKNGNNLAFNAIFQLYCTCTGPKNPGNFNIYFCTFALWKLLECQKFCISFPREPCIPALVIDEMDSSLFTFIETCPKGRYLNTLGV